MEEGEVRLPKNREGAVQKKDARAPLFKHPNRRASKPSHLAVLAAVGPHPYLPHGLSVADDSSEAFNTLENQRFTGSAVPPGSCYPADFYPREWPIYRDTDWLARSIHRTQYINLVSWDKLL